MLFPNNYMTKLRYFFLLLSGIVVGTGAYVMYPPAMYAFVGGLLLLYCISFAQNKYRINSLSSAVFSLYVAFLLLNYARDGGNAGAPLYLNFFLGICAYFLIIKTLQRTPFSKQISVLPLIGIGVIGAGIWLELNGFIDFRKNSFSSVDQGLLLRPGGFLNPNMSAALCLIWLYVAIESKWVNSALIKISCLSLSVAILSVTQSRSAILFLAIYLMYKVYEAGIKNVKYYFVLILGVFILLAHYGQSEYLIDLYEANFERAQGDSSSSERYMLIQTGIAAFSESPIVGLGMRAMYRYFGLGTHNEIIEWLVNFGLVGLVVVALILFRFYYINSIKYLCLCIFPTLLFSHNFFETTAFQVALAFAYYAGTRSEIVKTSRVFPPWRVSIVERKMQVHGSMRLH